MVSSSDLFFEAKHASVVKGIVMGLVSPLDHPGREQCYRSLHCCHRRLVKENHRSRFETSALFWFQKCIRWDVRNVACCSNVNSLRGCFAEQDTGHAMILSDLIGEWLKTACGTEELEEDDGEFSSFYCIASSHLLRFLEPLTQEQVTFQMSSSVLFFLVFSRFVCLLPGSIDLPCFLCF